MGRDADYRAIAEKSKGIKQDGFPELDPGHPVTVTVGQQRQRTRCEIEASGQTVHELWEKARAIAVDVAPAARFDVVDFRQAGTATWDTEFAELGARPVLRSTFAFIAVRRDDD